MARCLGWCGACYTNSRGRTNVRGHYQYRATRARRKQLDMTFLRKPCADSAPSAREVVELEGGWLRDHPALVEYLTCERWPDGSKRVTATLLISWSEGRFRVCVNDRDGQRSAWVSHSFLEEALRAVERGLQGDSLEWRRSSWGKGKGR